MDSLLLFYLFGNDKSSFLLPTGAFSIKICPKLLKMGLEESLKEGFPGMNCIFESEKFSICMCITKDKHASAWRNADVVFKLEIVMGRMNDFTTEWFYYQKHDLQNFEYIF